MNEAGKHYTVAEVARLLGLQFYVARRWIQRGYLHASEGSQGEESVPFDELVAFVRERRAPVSGQGCAPARELLIVDDLEPVLTALRRLVARVAPDRAVLTCRNGHDAVILALAHRCALLLVDVYLPGLDGVAACQRIRREAPDWEGRIVLMSAEVSASLQQRCLESGASDCIPKPSTLAAMRALLE